ncbi:MAG: hypothetical protein MR904_01500 [Clostridia bacterium]|nr:hypothetical protein [Clostridia bacterium]
MEEEPKRSNKKVKKQSINFWPLKILILAIALSLGFSLLSEYVMGATGIIIAVLVIILFVALSIITDMIGVAATACSKEPFMAMCSKKVRGAKEGLMLIRNADKVASLCNDVIGDVCGILSGAAGASIVARITVDFQNANLSILVASLITAFIAGVTIFGKALGKHTAMDNCNSIILRVGKILSLFTKQNKTKKVKDKKDKNLDEKPNE